MGRGPPQRSRGSTPGVVAVPPAHRAVPAELLLLCLAPCPFLCCGSCSIFLPVAAELSGCRVGKLKRGSTEKPTALVTTPAHVRPRPRLLSWLLHLHRVISNKNSPQTAAQGSPAWAELRGAGC